MKQIAFYLMLVSILLTSCYPTGADSYDDTDIVYTNYSEDFKFSSKSTYAMPDSIVRITGNLGEDEPPEFVKEPYNTQMLNQIAQNMADRGWTRVEDPENADLVLLPAASKTTTIYYWYDYWCWWYPYYCGWGYYPGAGYYSSYTTGSLVMSLIEDGDDHIEPHVVWTGIINGLASGTGSMDRVTRGIDQAFTQSPYLDIN